MDAEANDRRLTDAEQRQLTVRASQTFSPASPIRAVDVFAGRIDQLRAVVDAVNQPGQHALIYGERGVGKTSLANVTAELLAETGPSPVVVPHVNCDAGDDFASIWRKICRRVSVSVERQAFGLSRRAGAELTSLADHLGDEVTPERVLDVAELVTRTGEFIPVVDEFDRVADADTVRQFTDTIKALSDQVERATVVLVGVADTVEELIAEHQSVERALVQVRMPRMSTEELAEIVRNGLAGLGMTAGETATGYMTALSQGLPHYTHLLGLHSARAAVDDGERHVRPGHVDVAINVAIANAQQTLQRTYHGATMSPRPESLYRQVLLACALAPADQLGYFAPADVRGPMTQIVGKPTGIAAYSRHLSDFCEAPRGPVLERIGSPRRYRFRFKNPLLQPFVIMQGLSEGLIGRDMLGPQVAAP